MDETKRYIRNGMQNGDATDRILDKMDAQLNGVSSIRYSTKDVNDDPGTDVASVRAFRNSMQPGERSSTASPTGYFPKSQPEFTDFSPNTPPNNKGYYPNSPPENKGYSPNTPPENKGYLHKLYDNDINLLRELLKQNIANEEDEYSEPGTKATNGDSPEMEYTSNSRSKPASPIPSMRSDVEVASRRSTCRCGSDKEIEQLMHERDELRARVRRGEASRTTIEERKELERALHSSKSALFQERKRSRQQIEDLQDKLEEMEHHYDEIIAEKLKSIESLKSEISSGNPHPHHTEIEDPNIGVLQDNLRSCRAELKIGHDSLKKLQSNFDRLRLENVDLKHQIDKLSKQDCEQELSKLSSENTRMREKMEQMDRDAAEDRRKHDEEIRELQIEKNRLNDHVLNLTQKSRELSKELEERERKILEESTSREQELVQQNKNLNEKLDCLNAKLATAFSEKLSLEKDLEKLNGRYADDEHTRRENEEKLKKENKEILANVESLQLELAHVISKAKDLSVEFDHKEHCYNTAISDVCHKLSLLHRNMRPLSNEVRPFTFLPSQNSCKKSLSELTEISELVCRAGNEILSEVVRLRREARKRPDYMSTLRSNSDASIASEEVKMLRTKLTDKDNELQNIQRSMADWKSSTSQRLAKKFQEEMNLQVERKISQHRSDQLRQMLVGTKNPETPHRPPSHETSTVKLLSHLQGRVKQLRTENDLLRSSSFLNELTDHRNHEE